MLGIRTFGGYTTHTTVCLRFKVQFWNVLTPTDSVFMLIGLCISSASQIFYFLLMGLRQGSLGCE